MATAYDFWKTTDESDNGSKEAVQQIECELARDAEEVLDAVKDIDPPSGLIAAAILTGNWEAVHAHYHEACTKKLADRAIDVHEERQEMDARWAA